jgi:ribosomal protein L13
MTKNISFDHTTTYHVLKFGKVVFTGTKAEVKVYHRKLDRNVRCFCEKVQTSPFHSGYDRLINLSKFIKNFK